MTKFRKCVTDAIILFNTQFMVKTCQLSQKCPVELPIQNHTLHLIIISSVSYNPEHSVCAVLKSMDRIPQFLMGICILDLLLNNGSGTAGPGVGPGIQVSLPRCYWSREHSCGGSGGDTQVWKEIVGPSTWCLVWCFLVITSRLNPSDAWPFLSTISHPPTPPL